MSTYHATKYDSARDEVVALLSDEMEGFGDRGFGDVDSPTGYCQPVRIEDDFTFASLLPVSSHVLGYREQEILALVLEHEIRSADVHGYHLVQHNSQGFVMVSTTELRNGDDFDPAIALLERQYDEWAGEED